MKKILSVFLAVMMLITIMPFGTVSVSAADASVNVNASTAASRTNALANALNGRYFTTNQAICTSNATAACYNVNVIAQSWLRNVTGKVPDSYTLMPEHYYNSTDCVTLNAWSCAGFANYCLWYIYAQNTSDNVRRVLINCSSFTKSNMDSSGVRTGDVIRVADHHSFIYISHNSSGVTVLDSNWSSDNKVQKHTISWSWRSGSTMAITRGKNWTSGSDPVPSLTSDSKYSRFKGSKAYPCASSKFRCYNRDLVTSPGYIYVDDYCTINDFYTNGWCQVSCPWNDGTTKTVYTQISNFIKTPSTSIGSFTAQNYMNLYSTSSMGTKIFRVYPNDTCYTIGSSGSATQIFMPHGSGYYVLGWVQTAEIPNPNVSYTKDTRYPTPFKCRVLSTEKVPAATSVGGARISDMNVYVDDDCVITEIYTNGWCQFTCPWSDGTTKTLYLPLSEFINANVEPYTFKATQHTDTYFKADKAKIIGWIDAGDTVTVVSRSGSVSQAIYPADVGTRCAWADTEALKTTYTVSYNANGGAGAPANQTKTNGTALTLSSSIPTKTGYTFAGWATSASATAAAYAAGSIYTNDANVTLYAVWRINQYHITYDGNGVENAPPEQTKDYGIPVNLSTDVPVLEGFTFLGWATDSNAATAEYEAGATYNGNADVTLYAVWKAIPVTLTGISITNEPNITNYCLGDPFSTEGLTIAASYSNEYVDEMTDGFTVSSPDMSTLGTKTVTVTYEGFTATFDITVNPATNSKLTTTSKTIHSGEEFTVDVNIENNPGFCYLKLRLNYDAQVFEFVEATNGTISTDSFSTAGNALLWDADSNATADGTLVTLRFRAIEELEVGNYSLGVSFVEGYNYKEEDVAFVTENATITVVDFVCGDVTGDNVINGKDLVRLRKYLLTLDETSGTADVEISLGADTTCDGIVNGKDLVRLRKYLLNYDEETGTSPIVLGANG